MSEVTRMLEAIQQGDPKAAAELPPLVYEELRKLAAHKMASQPPGQTLQPTALVQEAWLRLAGNEEATFTNRAHFFAAAAQAMRRILIDNARRKQSQKRGGGWERVDVEPIQLAEPLPSADLLARGTANGSSPRRCSSSAGAPARRSTAEAQRLDEARQFVAAARSGFEQTLVLARSRVHRGRNRCAAAGRRAAGAGVPGHQVHPLGSAGGQAAPGVN